jgi:hypothetical protein
MKRRTHAPAGNGVYDDLLASLLWPRLFRVAGLAFRPARLGMALVLVVTLALLLHASDLWVQRGSHADSPRADISTSGISTPGAIVQSHFLDAERNLDAGQPVMSLLRIIALPIQLFTLFPGITVVLALPLALAWGVVGGAMSRTAATEFALGQRTHWMHALSLSLRRWAQHTTPLLLPLLLALALAGVVALVGRVLLGVQSVSALGGVAFGVLTILGLVIALVLLVYLFALPMLVPAVLIEGTDSIDAIQRSTAYVLAKPLKLAAYMLLLGVQLVVVVTIIMLVVRAGLAITGNAASLFLPDSYASLIRREAVMGAAVNVAGGESFPAWQERAGTLVEFWRRLWSLAPLVYAISYFFSAGASLYLLMRQACDGQDPAELWDPSHDSAIAPGARVDRSAPETDSEDAA